MCKLNRLHFDKKILIVMIGNQEMLNHNNNIIKYINSHSEYDGNTEFIISPFCVQEWDRFLTPWPAESKMKDRWFTGEGKVTLERLENEIMSDRKNTYSDCDKIYIAGYSLAGLFALWAQYEKNMFDGVICCSGSLWYPGWNEYISSHELGKTEKIYLSLGRKEPMTKHPLMKEVGRSTQLQLEMLQKNNYVDCSTLVWNDGGHFSDYEKRVADGILWVMK